MGEQSMRQCVIDRLETIREALPSHIALDEWLADHDFEMLHEHHGGNPIVLESIAHAFGYLEGVADATDMTVREMLDAADIKVHSFDASARVIGKPRKRSAR